MNHRVHSLCLGLINALFCGLSLLHAQDSDDPIQKLVDQFEGAKEKSMAAVHEEREKVWKAYLDDLAKIEKEVQEAGDLEGLLAVRKERETFSTTAKLGYVSVEGVKSAQKDYNERIKIVEEEEDQIANQLNGVYRQALERLQSDLTKAGDFESALRVKAMVDALPKEKVAVTKPVPKPVVTKTANPGNPWPKAPAPNGEEILDGGRFIGTYTLPVDRHRVHNKITLGAREPPKRADLYTLEGTSFSCTGDGELFIMVGNGYSYRTLFESAKLSGGLGVDWRMVDCVLERSVVFKGDGWRGRPQACRWILENCKVDRSFAAWWNTQDVGFNVTNSTFEDVEFPTLYYREDVDVLAQKETLVMKNCHFIQCKIPLSVLVTTVNCTFDDCVFQDDEATLEVKKPVQVTVYERETNNRLRDIPLNVTLIKKPIEEAPGETGRQGYD